jgi:hypothetical protein
MIKGIQLTLMIGPGVPVPVPRDILDALTSVQVNASSGEDDSGFELNFTLSKRSPLLTLFLLSGGASIPFVRVILVATINGTPEVLIDGMMTHHQVEPGSGGAATLKVQGKDLSTVMTYFNFSGLPYPAMPPVARVLVILAKYAWLGIIPIAIPSVFEDIPLPTNRIPRHQGTDLQYIQRLAAECGHVFYVDPGPAPGTSRAYWGPNVKVGVPQPALNIDMDAHTNVESLSFSFNKENKELPIVYIQTRTTPPVTLPIPIPDITPLNPPLGLVPPLPPRITPLDDTANMSPLQAVMRGLAYASQHGDAVSGSGSLDVLRYGRILKARMLVGVRGAGTAFDGLYYVNSVTHNIKRGEYKQSFTLARNGLVSTLPTVPA